MSRLLAISAELSAPPSRPLCFRDVSLAASVLKYDVVSVCERENWDFYAVWFRRYGLFDFCPEIVAPGEVNPDVELEYGDGKPVARLDEASIPVVLAMLRKYS